jgi:Cysteine sulfinate desulfinase/cysteine desulfurase and related enzymes
VVYLDNAATTKMSKEVYDEINLYLTEEYGNPSSIYKLGVRNKNAINKARNQIARN